MLCSFPIGWDPSSLCTGPRVLSSDIIQLDKNLTEFNESGVLSSILK